MAQMADESFMSLAENPHAGAEKMPVEFIWHSRQDAAASDAEGRPIFRDVEYIRIIIPGSRDEVVRPATDKDRARYSKQHAAFKAKQDQHAAAGTPLSAVPWMTRSQCEEMRHFNCHTVEALALMTDGNVSRFPGLRPLQQKAKDFLEAARGAAPLTAMRAKMEAMEAESATLRKLLEEQTALLAEMKKRKGKE